MKKILAVAAGAVALSACTAGTPGVSVGLGLGTGIGRHLGLGTSINIPVGFDLPKNKQDDKSKSENELGITYFNSDGTLGSKAVQGGFQRRLLGKQGSGYVVQDFYNDNGQKRTDPYVLERDRLLQFNAVPSNGSLVTYAYNGNLLRSQVFQNGKLISAQQ